MEKLILSDKKTSKVGNIYYNVMFLGKEMTVTINPAFDKNNKKIPSFLLRIEADTTTSQYNGRGATWRMVRKDGIMHQGNFLLDDVTWLVDIKKQDNEDFHVTMVEQVAKDLSDL